MDKDSTTDSEESEPKKRKSRTAGSKKSQEAKQIAKKSPKKIKKNEPKTPVVTITEAPESTNPAPTPTVAPIIVHYNEGATPLFPLSPSPASPTLSSSPPTPPTPPTPPQPISPSHFSHFYMAQRKRKKKRPEVMQQELQSRLYQLQFAQEQQLLPALQNQFPESSTQQRPDVQQQQQQQQNHQNQHQHRQHHQQPVQAQEKTLNEVRRQLVESKPSPQDLFVLLTVLYKNIHNLSKQPYTEETIQRHHQLQRSCLRIRKQLQDQQQEEELEIQKMLNKLQERRRLELLSQDREKSVECPPFAQLLITEVKKIQNKEEYLYSTLQDLLKQELTILFLLSSHPHETPETDISPPLGSQTGTTQNETGLYPEQVAEQLTGVSEEGTPTKRNQSFGRGHSVSHQPLSRAASSGFEQLIQQLMAHQDDDGGPIMGYDLLKDDSVLQQSEQLPSSEKSSTGLLEKEVGVVSNSPMKKNRRTVSKFQSFSELFSTRSSAANLDEILSSPFFGASTTSTTSDQSKTIEEQPKNSQLSEKENTTNGGV